MPLPREVLPGRTYMITRRCTQRQFLMRPDEATNNAFLYCLGLAADRAGVELLFTIANSNHHHTGIRDPLGTYPVFLEHFHKLFAKCQNAHRGRWENLWASEQCSVVRLVEPGDVLAKMVYALTNPVKDQLVEQAHHWPGASSLGATRSGRVLVATRPVHFFSDGGRAPKEVTLRFVRPVGFEQLSQPHFVAELDQSIGEVEAAAAAARRDSGRSVLGRAGVRRQHWGARPSSDEPHRQMNPRVAARSAWARVEALARNQAFAAAYRKARLALAAGIDLVPFPPGTYWPLKLQTLPRDEPNAVLQG